MPKATLDTADRSVDGAERLRLYRAAESRILQDAPWIPLVHPQFPVLQHPRLRNDGPHPVWLWRYENMWLSGVNENVH